MLSKNTIFYIHMKIHTFIQTINKHLIKKVQSDRLSVITLALEVYNNHFPGGYENAYLRL